MKYWKLTRGRYAGHHKIIRYCRVNPLGHVSYVEFRIKHDVKNNIPNVNLWKIGMCLYITDSMGHWEESNVGEYQSMMHEALKYLR